MNTAQGFWKRVDTLKGCMSLRELADSISLNYTTLINQRSKNRYPSRIDIMKISELLGVSVDSLLSDNAVQLEITPEMDFVRRNKRASWIIGRCIENERLLAILYSFVECLSKEAFDYLDK